MARATKAAGKADAASKADAVSKADTKADTKADSKPETGSTTGKRSADGKGSRKASGSRKAPRSAKLDKFLAGQLEVLEADRVTYSHQAESLRAEADLLAAEREPGDVQFDEESGEGDTLAVERERDLALSAQALEAIEQIDVAIAKIHDGTYGTCENCGTAIPKERLKALPYAALCVKCKSGGFARR